MVFNENSNSKDFMNQFNLEDIKSLNNKYNSNINNPINTTNILIKKNIINENFVLDKNKKNFKTMPIKTIIDNKCAKKKKQLNYIITNFSRSIQNSKINNYNNSSYNKFNGGTDDFNYTSFNSPQLENELLHNSNNIDFKEICNKNDNYHIEGTIKNKNIVINNIINKNDHKVFPIQNNKIDDKVNNIILNKTEFLRNKNFQLKSEKIAEIKIVNSNSYDKQKFLNNIDNANTNMFRNENNYLHNSHNNIDCLNHFSDLNKLNNLKSEVFDLTQQLKITFDEINNNKYILNYLHEYFHSIYNQQNRNNMNNNKNHKDFYNFISNLSKDEKDDIDNQNNVTKRKLSDVQKTFN